MLSTVLGLRRLVLVVGLVRLVLVVGLVRLVLVVGLVRLVLVVGLEANNSLAGVALTVLALDQETGMRVRVAGQETFVAAKTGRHEIKKQKRNSSVDETMIHVLRQQDQLCNFE